MTNFIVNLLAGHVLGDYFLQPAWMATKKGSSNKLALAHCAVYTFSIALFTSLNLQWLSFVFITHYLVDRYSLGDKWLNLIGGRTLEGFFESGHKNIPVKLKHSNDQRKLNYHILRGGFTSIVYVIVDNSIHLFSMYYFWILVLKFS